MTETHECEVFLMIDEDGTYEVSNDESDVNDRFNDATGGYQRKLYKLTLMVPLPATAEVHGELKPNEGGEYTLTING